MKQPTHNLIERSSHFFWYFIIAFLPITSMPIVAKILGSNSVASPSILFLLPATLLLLPKFWHGKRISRQLVPLACFFSIAGIASAFSFFYNIPPFKENQQLSSVIYAMATLGIGVLFFVAACSIPVNSKIKKTSLRIINWSGALILLWSFMQAAYWYQTNHYPGWMFEFQGIISDRVLYRQRVTGFALEPSWLAHQLNLLYLPVWMAHSINQTTNHRFKFLIFTFENILLFGGVIVLFLTYSRVGLLSFVTMLGILLIFLHQKILDKVESKISFTIQGKNKRIQHTRKFISGLMISGYLIFLLIIAFILSRTDPRMANLFRFSFNQDNSLLRFFDDLKFGDRVVYWLTGWNIFNEYPVLGVGLGNSGFFFNDHIPSFGWTLVEVRKLMYHADFLLNIKSLWVRLLAETGIIGFSVFIGWLVSICHECLNRVRSKEVALKVLGYMGLFSLSAMIAEGFSVDSFALPYWWICIGFSVAEINNA